jgi:hypothetical protein
MCHLFRLRVLAAVEFDSQALFETNKIHDVNSDRLLATKFVGVETAITQCVPEFALGSGLSAAQPAGESVFHRSPPHPQWSRFRE